MKITRSEVEDENNYTYSAESQDEEGEPTGNTIVLVSVEGYKAATLQLGEKFYRILPIDQSNN